MCIAVIWGGRNRARVLRKHVRGEKAPRILPLMLRTTAPNSTWTPGRVLRHGSTPTRASVGHSGART